MATAGLTGPGGSFDWPQMDNPFVLAAWLGLSSLTIVQKLLDQWKTTLSSHDHLLLTSSTNMVVKVEPFPLPFSWHQILRTAPVSC